MKKTIALFVVTAALMITGCSSKDDEKIIIDGEVVSDSETASFVYSEENGENVNEEKAYDDIESEKNTYIVYVCGEVKEPGVYEVYEQSRVIDAINAAGGVNDEASVECLNLASYVSDGEKIYVPSIYEEVATDMSTGSSNSGTNATEKTQVTSKINLNTADKTSLMTIPGVGESKANKIIAYREEHGKFSKPEDLMLVSGIKEGMFNKVKDYICVN